MYEDDGWPAVGAFRVSRKINVSPEFSAINAFIGEILSHVDSFHSRDAVNDSFGSILLNPARIFQGGILLRAYDRQNAERQENRGVESSLIYHDLKLELAANVILTLSQ